MKKVNNKILILVLLLLMVVFVSTRVFRSPARESNLNNDIFKVDTSRIKEVKLYTEADQWKEIQLIKTGAKPWKVKRDTITSETESYPLNHLLNIITRLKPTRIVTRKKEKWKEYNVGDTAKVKVLIKDEMGKTSEWYIGKEKGGTTYMRVEGSDEVYGVDGYILDAFNKKFNDWRRRMFLRFDKEAITRVRFQYPADSSFVLEKKDKVWMIGTETADSVKVQDYLSKLHVKDLTDFADDFKPETTPDVVVEFEGKSEVKVKGWKKSFYQWVLNSSSREGVYFLDEGMRTFPEVFVGKKYFTAIPSKK